MKGRKPKKSAVRRGLSDSYGIVPEPEIRGIRMPADIKEDELLSEIWSWVAPPVNAFTEQDIPIVRELVHWHGVYATAFASIKGKGNRIEIFDQIGTKDAAGQDGKKLPLYRKHPALSIMKEASTEIRALSEMLGLSPLARSRIGLMDATKTKTAADTAAMFRSIDAAYELPSEVSDV